VELPRVTAHRLVAPVVEDELQPPNVDQHRVVIPFRSTVSVYLGGDLDPNSKVDRIFKAAGRSR